LVTMSPSSPRPPLFPYTTLFRSTGGGEAADGPRAGAFELVAARGEVVERRGWGAGLEHQMPRFARARIERSRHVESVEQRHVDRSEEHTSELQSRENLVCRLLLE